MVYIPLPQSTRQSPSDFCWPDCCKETSIINDAQYQGLLQEPKNFFSQDSHLFYKRCGEPFEKWVYVCYDGFYNFVRPVTMSKLYRWLNEGQKTKDSEMGYTSVKEEEITQWAQVEVSVLHALRIAYNQAG